MRTWRILVAACLTLIVGACLASEAAAAVYSNPDPIEFTGGAPHDGSVYPSAIEVSETGTITDVNVDSAGPEPVDESRPSITMKTRKLAKKRGIVVRFSGEDDLTPSDQLTFTCRLDKGTPRPCTSPAKFKKLSPGRHKIAVVATDEAGKTSRTARKSFKIKKKGKGKKGKGKKKGKKGKRR